MAASNPWVIAVDSEPKDKSYLPSIGNGYLGTVIDSKSVYLAGLYAGSRSIFKRGVIRSKRARIPSTANMRLQILDTTLQRSALDLEKAVFKRVSTLDNPPPNSSIRIEQRYYAHRRFRSILVHEIEVDYTTTNDSVNQDVVLEFRKNYVKKFKSWDLSFKSKTVDTIPHCSVWEGRTILPEAHSEKINVAIVTHTIPKTITVSPRRKTVFVYLTAIRSTLDTQTPLEAAISDFQLAEQSKPTLLQAHVQDWARLWSAGVEVNGNSTLAHQINSSYYYILSSTRDDWAWPTSPGGIPTNGYYGNVFWDWELWIYPALLPMFPREAKIGFIYRYLRKECAAHAAKRHGYKGYYFPWQSAFSGHRVDFFPAMNNHEKHVGADIAMAMKWYWCSTKDIDFMQNYGWDMLRGIANFWGSVVRKDKQTGKYHTENMVGPDEHAFGFPLPTGIKDSVYINVIAKLALEFAIETAVSILALPMDKTLEAEIAVWKDVAENIVILFDEEKQMHPEYQGFPKGNRLAGGMVKQADVVLLGYPLQHPMPAKVRRNDLEFYEPITQFNGPAMTHSMHAIAWLELNEPERAAERFLLGTKNMQLPFYVWTETPDPYYHPANMGCFNFLTGAGGFLQSIIHGYGGIRFNADAMIISPTLPQGVQDMKFKSIHYTNFVFDFTFNSRYIEFVLKAQLQQQTTADDQQNLIAVCDSSGVVHPLVMLEPLRLPLGRFQVISTFDPRRGNVTRDVVSIVQAHTSKCASSPTDDVLSSPRASSQSSTLASSEVLNLTQEQTVLSQIG